MTIIPRLKLVVKITRHWLWNKWLRLMLGLALSISLGWLTVRGMDWDLVLREFQHFPITYAVASLAFFLVLTFVRAYRWQVLFLREKPPMLRLFLVQNAGIGVNNLMPVRVLSEVTKFALLTWRYKVKGGVALATLGVERVLDMLVSAVILMASLALLPSGGDFLPYMVGALLLGLAFIMAVPFFIWVGTKSFLRRVAILASMAASLLDMTKNKLVLGYSTLVTFFYWLGIGMCAWILAQGMGLNISPFVATVTILGTLVFATALPSAPAAIGTFEAAVIYVLIFFGVAKESAFSYGVVLHALLFLPPVVIALVVFSIMGLKPLKEASAMKDNKPAQDLASNGRKETS